MKGALAFAAGIISFVLCIALFNAIWPAMGFEAWWALGTALWVIIWWVGSVFPIGITALLPVILLPAGGVIKFAGLSETYANPIIFLFFGGFLLALALEKWNIHTIICQRILRITGSRIISVVVGFGICSFLLSMWISNTATAIMMLGLAMPVVSAMPNLMEQRRGNVAAALLLAIAWGSNIGGTSTLIGTPPNIVLAGMYEQRYHEALTFAFWIKHVFPLSMSVFVLAMILLVVFFKIYGFHGAKILIQFPTQQGLNTQQKRTFALFIITALLWSFQPAFNIVLEKAGIAFRLSDSWIAMAAGLLLFIIPASNFKIGTYEGLLSWDDLSKTRFDILLLFGGGLSIAKGLESAGVINQIGAIITNVSAGNPQLLSVLFTTSSLFLTEVMSNVALTSIMVPVSFEISGLMKMDAMNPALAVTLASSFAFMLPIATPPNAIIFSVGKLHMRHMIYTGFLLNLICLLLLIFFNWMVFG